MSYDHHWKYVSKKFSHNSIMKSVNIDACNGKKFEEMESSVPDRQDT